MKPAVGARTAQGHESALEHLARELSPALRALDDAAADPWAVAAHVHELPALQYALHAASERVLELAPALGTAEACQELGTALAIAREETSGVAIALDELGAEAAAGLVWEWRGALFGVRLALLQADAGGELSDSPEELPSAYAPVVLVALGVAAVLGGALAELWPLWTVGFVLIATSALASQLRP